MIFVPLVLGFTSNLLSAFTTLFVRYFGERKGTLVSFVLRAILGIPLWMLGWVIAIILPSQYIFQPTILTWIVGVGSIVIGCMVTYTAFTTMRFSALLPSTADELVSKGIYAHIRHPMDMGMICVFAGIALIKPTHSIIVAGIIGIIWAIMQAYAEEIDLVQRLPAYRDYMNRVPPFLPHITLCG